jgi:hypothetical protein
VETEQLEEIESLSVRELVGQESVMSFLETLFRDEIETRTAA